MAEFCPVHLHIMMDVSHIHVTISWLLIASYKSLFMVHGPWVIELKLYFRKIKYTFDFNTIHFDNFHDRSSRFKYSNSSWAPPTINATDIWSFSTVKNTSCLGGSYWALLSELLRNSISVFLIFLEIMHPHLI